MKRRINNIVLKSIKTLVEFVIKNHKYRWRNQFDHVYIFTIHLLTKKLKKTNKITQYDLILRFSFNIYFFQLYTFYFTVFLLLKIIA